MVTIYYNAEFLADLRGGGRNERYCLVCPSFTLPQASVRGKSLLRASPGWPSLVLEGHSWVESRAQSQLSRRPPHLCTRPSRTTGHQL